jgi:dihydroxy-acid dehydratase
MNAMVLDIAMGGSTNTVLHLLAIAHEAEVDFTMKDIDELSRKTPVICKVAPSSSYHVEDVHRAGGILTIMGSLEKRGLLDTSVRRVDGLSLIEAINQIRYSKGKLLKRSTRIISCCSRWGKNYCYGWTGKNV